MFDGLKAANRLPELHPLFGVFNGHIERLLSGPDHLGTQPGDGLVEDALENRPALAHFADDLRAGHRNILKSDMTLATRHINGFQLGNLDPW